MSSSSIHIPEGFLFMPSDQELLLSFLRRRLLRQPLPWEGIVERDLYGEKANPWELFTDNDPWNILLTDDDDDSSKVKKTIYVFTKLSKLGRQGNKNVIRTAGCGKWHGHTAPKDIVKGKTKTKIGSKRMFTFKSTKKDFDGKGHWIMHEYSLSDDGLIGIGSTDYVVCRITKDESKNFKKQENSEIILVSEADTQALGKRKSREEIYIPQEEKTPRLSFPGEHHVTIGVDTDMVQGNLWATASFGVDSTMSIEQLPWYANNGSQAEVHMEESIENDMVNVDASAVSSYMPEDQQHPIAVPAEFDNSAKPDHISNEIDTSSMEESVQNNTENIDTSAANPITPQGLQHSERLQDDDDDDMDIYASNLQDILLADSAAELDSNTKADHISNGIVTSSMEEAVQNNAEHIDASAANPDILRDMECYSVEYERLQENDEENMSFMNGIFLGDIPEADSF